MFAWQTLLRLSYHPNPPKWFLFFFLTHYSLNLASDNLLTKPVYSFIGLVFIVSPQHVRCLFETGASWLHHHHHLWWGSHLSTWEVTHELRSSHWEESAKWRARPEDSRSREQLPQRQDKQPYSPRECLGGRWRRMRTPPLRSLQIPGPKGQY